MKYLGLGDCRSRVILLLCIALILTVEYWLFGPYSYSSFADNMNSFIVRYKLVASDINAGKMSYNYPYTACGVDMLANSFIPGLLLIFVLLPYWVAFQTAFVLQVFVSLVGTFLLARDAVKLRVSASILVSLTYTIFNTVTRGNNINAFLGEPGLPLTLWAMHLILVKDRGALKTIALMVAVGLVYGMVSSLPVVVPFVLPVMAFWLLWLTPVRRSVVSAFGFVMFCVGVVVPNFPALQAMKLNGAFSHRIDMTFQNNYGGFFSELISMARTYLLGDHVTSFLLLLLLALVLFHRQHRNYGLLLRFAILSLLCASSSAIFKAAYPVYSQSVPSLQGFDLGRFFLVTPLFWSVCGGIAFQMILDGTKNTRTQKHLSVAIAALLIVQVLYLKMTHLKEWLAYGNMQTNYNIAQVAEIKRNEMNGMPFRIAVVQDGLRNGAFGVVCPEFIQFQGIETPDGLLNIYPKSYKDYWALVLKPILGRDDGLRKQFEDWGNGVYLFSPPNSPTPIPFRDYYDLDVLSLSNTKYIISRRPLLHSDLVLVSEPTRTTIDWNRASWSGRIRFLLRENFLGKSVFIYQNTGCRPRVYLKSEPENGEVMTESFEGDNIRVMVRAEKEDTLVFANSRSPYWMAEVNGAKKEMVPIGAAFVGVPVHSGVSSLWIKYVPPYRIPGTY